MQLVQNVRGHLQSPRFDSAVGIERETGYPAKGSDVGVLFSDRLTQSIDFDLARLGSQLARLNRASKVGVERLEKRRGEAPGRSEPRARGDVGKAGDFDADLVHASRAEAFADDGMPYGIRAQDPLRAGVFRVGILDDHLWPECPADVDIDVLVDGGGDQETTVFPVVRRKVGTAAAE